MQKSSLPAPLNRWRLTVMTSFYGLLLLLFANSMTYTTGFSVTTVVIWLIQSVPLLIFVPSLLRNRIRAFAWLSFVVLIYFIHGVLNLFNPAKLTIGVIESSLCSLLFTALVFYLRRYKDHYKVSI